MKKMTKVILGVFLVLFICSAAGFSDSILSPQRTQGLVAPAAIGNHDLVVLKGPGKFVSAQISKQGGNNDLTFVSLDIDGVNVVNASFAAIKNWGLTASNPYGIVLLQSGAIKTVTIGYFSPLVFQKELKLKVGVQENGVVQILANVVHGK